MLCAGNFGRACNHHWFVFFFLGTCVKPLSWRPFVEFLLISRSQLWGGPAAWTVIKDLKSWTSLDTLSLRAMISCSAEGRKWRHYKSSRVLKYVIYFWAPAPIIFCYLINILFYFSLSSPWSSSSFRILHLLSPPPTHPPKLGRCDHHIIYFKYQNRIHTHWQRHNGTRL